MEKKHNPERGKWKYQSPKLLKMFSLSAIFSLQFWKGSTWKFRFTTSSQYKYFPGTLWASLYQLSIVQIQQPTWWLLLTMSFSLGLYCTLLPIDAFSRHGIPCHKHLNMTVSCQLPDFNLREAFGIFIMDVQLTNLKLLFDANMSCQHLRKVSITLLNLCYKALRQLWSQKGVQPSNSNTYLVKCPLHFLWPLQTLENHTRLNIE